MESRKLKAQLGELINAMMEEKILSDYFYEIQMLRTSKNPSFIVEIVTTACVESGKFMSKLESLVVGAGRVLTVNKVLRNCCSSKDREGCVKAFTDVREEYLQLRAKLQMIIELENRIMMAEAEEKKK
ncbi:uncharacterized protein A4U43_C02F8460 [Asparagus officinalis]|uniref:Histidine-containing phosphotransfer protein n=1 Tax=Asparagus officinalis TaxID=4686 RepID=A0A5P1FHS2_ASPOF|nr:uncharacterized protein A4U43_C02F8460 [Asparagus officinalis]